MKEVGRKIISTNEWASPLVTKTDSNGGVGGVVSLVRLEIASLLNIHDFIIMISVREDISSGRKVFARNFSYLALKIMT